MVNWILEKDIFDENLDRLQEAIVSHGMSYEVVEYIPFEGGDFTRFGPTDFFYGCLEFACRVQRDSSCTVFNTVKAYECASYYAAFKDLLLNGDGIFIPYSDLVAKQEWLFKTFGSGEYDCIFVRPSSGLKTFTGLVMCKDTLQKDIEFIERYSDIPPDAPIVVASAKNIDREYRFVVQGNRVITGSLYKIGPDLTHSRLTNAHTAFNVAQELIKGINFDPDPVWILDTCLTKDGKWFVLEVGCLSCAGLYACDLDKVVAAVKETFPTV